MRPPPGHLPPAASRPARLERRPCRPKQRFSTSSPGELKQTRQSAALLASRFQLRRAIARAPRVIFHHSAAYFPFPTASTGASRSLSLLSPQTWRGALTRQSHTASLRRPHRPARTRSGSSPRRKALLGILSDRTTRREDRGPQYLTEATERDCRDLEKSFSNKFLPQ